MQSYFYCVFQLGLARTSNSSVHTGALKDLVSQRNDWQKAKLIRSGME